MGLNIDAIISQIGEQISYAANDARKTISSGDIVSNPEAMLAAQYALQQYSVLIGYDSSVMKSMKDMMMGIISKIG